MPYSIAKICSDSMEILQYLRLILNHIEIICIVLHTSTRRVSRSAAYEITPTTEKTISQQLR
jgi:hypothetical protein